MIVYCIHADALARSGEAVTESPDANGKMRLRPPGLGIYVDIAPTITRGAAHAIVITEEEA